jgi:hypothetical protein
MATAKKAAKLPGGPGRPIVAVRVAPNLRDRMTQLAKAEGMDFSDWLRAALLSETRRQERDLRAGGQGHPQSRTS